MKISPKILFSVCAAIAMAFASQASANLVTNGGFEDGTFNGWTQGGNLSGTFVTVAPVHSGLFAASLGPFDDGKSGGGPGTLSQTLSTSAGASYDLSFFLAGSGGEGNALGAVFGNIGSVEFQAFWNGVMIYDSTNPSFPYAQHSFNLLATGTSTVLQFVFHNDPSFWYLDDVSVNQIGGSVPDNFSTLWLALPTIGMLGFMQMRRKTAVGATA